MAHRVWKQPQPKEQGRKEGGEGGKGREGEERGKGGKGREGGEGKGRGGKGREGKGRERGKGGQSVCMITAANRCLSDRRNHCLRAIAGQAVKGGDGCCMEAAVMQWYG